MGVILQCLDDQDLFLKLNWWNWRPLLAVIERGQILPQDMLEGMGMNLGTKVTEAQAQAILAHIKETLKPQEGHVRMLLDGTWTSEPGDTVFYKEPDEAEKNYALSREGLAEFEAFCVQCRGFRVY